MNCPAKKCKGTIKKEYNEDGSYYYRCASCGYTSQTYKPRR